MFRALSHRNYRLFWTGAFLSNVGTWMQAVAQGWLVLKLTNSPFWLGLDAFMATAPAFVFTLSAVCLPIESIDAAYCSTRKSWPDLQLLRLRLSSQHTS